MPCAVPIASQGACQIIRTDLYYRPINLLFVEETRAISGKLSDHTKDI
jgi:hypothetical protein